MTARLTAFLILSLFIFESAQGSTYYVKPGGDDTKDGLSWSTAWRTVTKVNAAVRGGDTCYFGPGTYPACHLIPASGGSASDRTAYISGDGATNSTTTYGLARLCGGDSLPTTGWTQNGNVFSRPYTPTSTYEAGHFYVMGQNDSMLTFVNSVPTSAGHFYYDGTTLYVYLYSINGAGYNPASYGVWTGTQIPVDFSATSGSADYVTVLGFDIRYSRVSGVFFGWSQCNYALISHCKVQYNGQGATGNGALIGSRSQQPDGVHNTIRACYMDFSTIDPASQEAQAYATDFYTQSWLVIESCYVGPHISEFGLYFKGSPVSSTHITYRYNQINAKGYIGIYVRGKIDTVLAYGNQIYNCNNTGIGIGNADAGSKYVRIENNSISVTSGGQAIGLGWYLPFTGPVIVRRNIVTGGSYDYKNGTVGASFLSIDSNMYYTPTSTFSACGGYGGCELGNLSLSQWQSYGGYGWDTHSKTNVNPNFASAATGDLSRPTSSAELSAVLPDGTPVTRYGAWQSGGIAPLNWIQADSIHSDYSGEMDSLRLRVLTATPTAIDSVIYALTTTGSLPTYGQGTDRWSKRYPGATKYDTLYIMKQITETDTVIVGAWAKSNDSGYSAGVYDTLILRAAAPQTPVPLNYIQIDSIHSDFSADSDSLRVRFQTQAQAGNDSVVMAISLTGALPTFNSTDRWAKAYVASTTDTSIIIRQIIEPDTIIIGGWVKIGSTWSTAKYDTLILTVPALQSLAYMQADSVHSNFSGNTDSLRVRYQTTSQTFPDSVIYSLTTNGSLPTYSQSSDRWSRAYVVSKTDSVYVTKAITEPDTVIVGAWIKDGSVYSSAKYDTVILVVPPLQALSYVQADSVHSNFSGNTDSLRISYQTSSQTFPDSVIYALTTNGALPTSSQATDRWSRPYAASKTDTTYLTKAITEPDTVIVGAWVKYASAYSSARYDTVVLFLPPPDPPLLVALDSAVYDYSGESDSLRFRYQTGTQYGPDSVIVALSLTTTANPTYSQTVDRWARPYSPSSDVAFWGFEIINEPDTVIVGSWIKRGAVYSSPVFRTVVLNPNFVITNVSPADVTSGSANIDWATNLISTSQVEYGQDTTFGYSTTRDANKVKNHSVSLTGLLPGRTYYFRAVSDPGVGPKKSSVDSFVTNISTGGQLIVSNDDTTSVTDSSATVVWTTSSAATSQVQFGITTAYGRFTIIDSNMVVNHQVFIKGLSPKTTYHWRVVSMDQFGNQAVGADHYFRTLRSSLANISRHKPPKTSSARAGYNPNVITDSIIDPYSGSKTVWISAASASQSQWVEIDMGIDSLINKVVVYWAWDGTNATWMTSQAYAIQKWTGTEYEDVALESNPQVGEATVTSFPITVKTSKIRIFQPANLGPIDHPEVLALTEIELYGVAGVPAYVDTSLQVTSSSNVEVTQPVLKVRNLASAGAHTYYFVLATDSTLNSTVAASAGVPQQIGDETGWKVTEPLEAGVKYFWRANADHEVYTPVQSFTVTPRTHAYPNPFALNGSSMATFTDIPAGSSLIILTVSGDIVKRWTNNTGVDILWDGRNESGHTVSPGVYLWYIEKTGTSGKLIVTAD